MQFSGPALPTWVGGEGASKFHSCSPRAGEPQARQPRGGESEPTNRETGAGQLAPRAQVRVVDLRHSSPHLHGATSRLGIP